MSANTTQSGRARAALLEERERLVRRLTRRGDIEKALLDGDPLMPFFLSIVAGIFAVELAFNLANVSGWVAWVHYATVGTLECFTIYFLFAAARSAWDQNRLRRVDVRLRKMTLPVSGSLGTCAAQSS